MQVDIQPLEDQKIQEPITVNELMRALHLTDNGRINEDELEQAITRARAMAESTVNSPIVLTQFKLTAYVIDSYFIEFTHNMTGITVTGIINGEEGESDTETALVKSTNFTDNPCGIYLTQTTMDAEYDSISVIFNDGPYRTPEQIRQSVTMMACNIWKGEPISQYAIDTLAPYRRQNI